MESAEGTTAPVDSNNNGCAGSTEAMCSGGAISLTVCDAFF